MPDDLGLYNKPMARNAQLWTDALRLLLDGPNATPDQIDHAAAAVAQGGTFGYRLQWPAMRVGRHAYGMQYHCEILPQTVSDWAVIPAYACALDAALGNGAMPKLQAAAAEAMPGFNRDARRLYRNFMQAARRWTVP